MLKKFKHIIVSDPVFYGCLIFFIILLGQLPIILHIFHTPKGYYYPLLDRISFSDYYYLGIIRYAMGPEWLLKIPYVIYDHQASFIQVFFVLLGKLSLLTGLGPEEIFAIARAAGGILYALSAGFLFKTILGKREARWAFILFLFAQPLPALDFFGRVSQDLDNWQWHFGEAARRISAMPPHYTFGKALAVFSVVFLLVFLKKRKVKYIITASLLVFIAGIIYPPPVFIVVFSMVVTCFAASPLRSECFFAHLPNSLHNLCLRHESRGAQAPVGVLKKHILPADLSLLSAILSYFLAAVLPLLLLKHELAKGYPWDMWNKVELGWNTISMQFEWGYMRMLGLSLLLVPVAIMSIFRGKLGRLGYLRVFIIVWFFSSFMLFPFANFLTLGKFRFVEGAQIVPLAILAWWGLEFLGQRAKMLRNVFLTVFAANFVIFTLLQVRWSTLRFWPYWTNVYFRPQELLALSYLDRNVPPGSIMAADAFSSNYLPAFARVRTILGFPDFYPKFMDFRNDENEIQDILNDRMDEGTMRDFLISRKVNYIYADTTKYPAKSLHPDLLTIAFQNNIITIYHVKAL